MLLRSLFVVVLVAAVGCTGKYVRETTNEMVAITPERVERGKYLVETVGACGACHTTRENDDLTNPELPDHFLAGGNTLAEGDLRIFVPNITNDPETGLGRWSDDQIIRAVRDGVRPDGRFLFPIMPFGTYQHISDEDMRSIVAYLRTAPAVKQPVPRKENEIPFFPRLAINAGVAMHKPAVNVPEPDRTSPVKYGEYLANVGHCSECHSRGARGVRETKVNAGSDVPFELSGVGKVWAANITPDKETGLGRYTPDQVKAMLRGGVRPDGKLLAAPMILFIPHLALAKEEDVDALVAYLQSLPPVKNQVPARQLTAQWKQLTREE